MNNDDDDDDTFIPPSGHFYPTDFRGGGGTGHVLSLLSAIITQENRRVLKTT